MLLADEINRASPKTQSALLEAMAEEQVTVDGNTHALAQPFFVVATQNPLDLNGTFPLPDSQLDRFMLRLCWTIPIATAERAMLTGRDRRDLLAQLAPHLDGAALLALHRQAQTVTASAALLDYLQALLAREPPACRKSASACRRAPAWRCSARRAHGRCSAVARTSCRKTCRPCSSAGRAPPAARARRQRRTRCAATAGRGRGGLMRAVLQRAGPVGRTPAARADPLPAAGKPADQAPPPPHLCRADGFGVGFALLLLVMLLGALNYANNAALLLTCLLGAAAAPACWWRFAI